MIPKMSGLMAPITICSLLLGNVKPFTLPKTKQYRVIPNAHMSAAFPLYLSREPKKKIIIETINGNPVLNSITYLYICH